ncbi:MotE family protein [Paenibacillus dendritiformis]|uniref:MotE family protein n=2 Tax=Paenibacillus dendritiformis TaxID=130049 RepID=UPI0020C1EA49|nr:primosomal protein [Paenibacillus dendritiformis]CAH8770001.1 primosomal protein [Paenibacillus dendritiformis]
MRVAEMNQESVEKESGYSGFERFLFFATPILFTIILLAVLLTLFNANWRNQMIALAENIPIVNQWISSDKDKAEGKEPGKAKKENKNIQKEQEEQIAELKALLASKDADLRNLADARKTLEEQVANLNKEIKDLRAERHEEQVTEEQYAQQVKDLANLYAKMMPSKSAPILENLATEELVLVLDAMKQEDRAKILEKMNPKVAADASIRLKDVKPADNLEVRALQARLKKNEASKEAHNGLDRTQLSQTFASMTPKSAASILLETAKISPEKALNVLNTVDDATRSRLLNAMTEEDKEATAKLVSKLLPSK